MRRMSVSLYIPKAETILMHPNAPQDLATRLEAVKAQYKRDLDIAVANLSPEQIKSENLARAARRQSGKSKKKNLMCVHSFWDL